MKINRGWGSHIPVLVKAMQMTKGTVLELGTGIYSTPVMHWLCYENKRPLVSYESDQKYFLHSIKYKNDFHEVYFIEDWNKINLDRQWSVVLVDTIEWARRDLVKLLTNNSQYVVLHDTNPKLDNIYHYSEIYGLFKYRYDYTRADPNTTIVSNFHDVSDFMKGGN